MTETEAARKVQVPSRPEVTAEEVRLVFGELLNRVGYAGERVVITRHGKPTAALVSIADLAKLDALVAA